MAKLQPSVMTLNFRLDGTSGFIDLSQACSLVNRRFYRQGLQWAVSGVSLTQNTASTTAGSLTVETLPTTWVSSNAWHKSFASWLKQQNEAIEEYGAESTVAKFRDFKIFMDTAHVQAFLDAGSDLNVTNMLPRTAVSTFTAGEWDPSQIVVPNYVVDPATGSPALVDPAEFYLHMVGANFGPSSASRGMIDGYQYSRAFPQSPDPVSPAQDSNFNWMRDMFDVGNDSSEIVDNATDNNDQLPYPQVDYPGGDTQAPQLQLISEHYISGAQTIDRRISVSGFMAPCGLIKIGNQPGTALDIQVHLMPGTHIGYLAEPMQDM
jgi:hypothetical protein